MKTYAQKPAEVTRQWVLIDASSATMGRVSSLAAKHLIGKHYPTYTAHVDGGDHVVIINADQLQVNESKLTQKKYYRHSGHPGSLKTETLGDIKATDAKKAIELAVKGMLPKNKLGRERFARLHVYNGPEHKNHGQQPKKVEVK
jgi:large subunit ribosomal protein L13